jgi:predicted small lipoprotein YifL
LADPSCRRCLFGANFYGGSTAFWVNEWTRDQPLIEKSLMGFVIELVNIERLIRRWKSKMNQFKRAVLWGVLLSLVLSACGIKGPLYIPEKKYPQKTSLRLEGSNLIIYKA